MVNNKCIVIECLLLKRDEDYLFCLMHRLKWILQCNKNFGVETQAKEIQINMLLDIFQNIA